MSLQLEVRDPKLHAGAAHDLRSLMQLFADWSVLQVEHHADPLVVRTVALSSVGTAFNLHEIDKEWQQDVRDLLQACRVHVPCPWHVAVNMPLRTLVPVGDDALVMLLVVAMERVTFTAKMRQAALRYPNPNPNPNPDPNPGPKPDPVPNSSPSSNPDLTRLCCDTSRHASRTHRMCSRPYARCLSSCAACRASRSTSCAARASQARGLSSCGSTSRACST